MSKQEKQSIDRELDALDKKISGEKKSDLIFDERFHLKCEKGHVFTREAGICNACRYGKHPNLDL